jgi:hypothetical protein
MRGCNLHFPSKVSKVTKAIPSAHGSRLKFGRIGIYTARIVIARNCIDLRQTCPRSTSIALAAGRAFN